MESEESNEHNKSSQRYLAEIASAYTLDTSSGIYKPQSYSTQDDTNKAQHSSDRSHPFWVNVVRDWPVLFVSLGTLILLIATVHYARKQWQEANRTAVASIMQAHIAQESFSETEAANVRQARENILNREEAQKAADQTIRQSRDALSASINNFALDQRAWVGLEADETIGGVDSPRNFQYQSLRVSFRNSGRTPALKLRFIRNIGVEVPSDEPQPNPEEWDRLANQQGDQWLLSNTAQRCRMFPDECAMFKTQETIARRDFLTNHKVLEQERIGEGEALAPGVTVTLDIKPNQAEMHIAPNPPLPGGTIRPTTAYRFLEINYIDSVRRQEHQTTVCLMRQYGTSFQFCLKGNTMD